MPAGYSPSTNGHTKPSPSPSKSIQGSNRSWFSVPAPVKRFFDAFPLRTLPANELPFRAQRAHAGDGHALFVWSTDDDAVEGRASFNPGCLRWQAYLMSRGIKFHNVPSSNHASTTERLPFLLPASGVASPFKTTGDVVSAHDLDRWANDQQDSWPKELGLQYDAYMSLLNNEIRLAWQYHMYMTPNFETFIVPSYIGTHSTSSFVRILSAWELRKAARDNLLRASPKIDVEGLYSAAFRAFGALDNLMKRKQRMAGNATSQPSLLEATVFSYLFLLLESPVGNWKDDRLVRIVLDFPDLIQLEERLKERFGNLQPPSIYT